MIHFFTYNLRNQLAVYCVIGAALVFFGCRSGEKQPDETSEPGIPEHIDTLENLTVFSSEEQTPDTVELVREQVFESNDEVFIKGYMGEVAVDNQDRVYIESTAPGQAGIYIFELDGSYITTIGRFGQGPGEFESIGSMDIRHNRLYIFDPRLQRVTVFSLDDFSIIKDETIDRDKVKTVDTMAFTSRGSRLFATSGEQFLLGMNNSALNKEDDLAKKFYYRLSADGTLLPERVLELDRYQFFFPETERNSGGDFRMPGTMPFSPGSVVAISDDDLIYTTWSEDFLIKVYDEDGNYRRAIYHPYKKSPLVISEIDVNERERDLINENSNLVPDTWPAIHTMEIDDENHLWVSTITDSDSTFQWWVLDQKGKLLARFTLPGERASRNVMGRPVILIKNGYFYSRERDQATGIGRTFKDRIVFKER